MARSLFHRLLVLVIHLINGLFLLIPRLTCQKALTHRNIADVGPVLGVVRDALCQNIHGPGNRFLRGAHAAFLGDIGRSRLLQRLPRHLQADQIGKRLQSFFLGNHSPGTALWLIRAVQILHRNQSLSLPYLPLQLRRQLLLLGNGNNDLLLSLLQIAQILEPLVQRPENLVIQRTGSLFSISGNKGNGIPLVDQFHGSLRLGRSNMQFFCQLFDYVHGFTPLAFTLHFLRRRQPCSRCPELLSLHYSAYRRLMQAFFLCLDSREFS